MHASHSLTRRVAVVGLAAAALTVSAGTPASATVHEIVAQYCSGQDTLEPPGLDPREGKKNFAQPVFANGFVGDPVLVNGVYVLDLDFDHPASKVVATDELIPIGVGPDGTTPLFLPAFEPDPEFPAFQHCPAMAP